MTNPQSSPDPPADYPPNYSEYPESSPAAAPADRASSFPDPDRGALAVRQSHIISRVLSPAVKLWLRSQAEQVGELQVLIEGGDRQILSGLVPRVTISAADVIYQGLHITEVQLVGRGIKVNLAPVLRGKPLRLERVVPVQGEVVMREEDLNESFESSLLAIALTDIFTDLLRMGAAPELVDPNARRPINLDNFWAIIHPGVLTLGAEIISVAQGTATPFVIRTGLRLANGQQLCLDRPEWLPTPKAKRGLALHDLDGFPFDLGTDVEIQEILLEEGQLICRGKINVIPAED